MCMGDVRLRSGAKQLVAFVRAAMERVGLMSEVEVLQNELRRRICW
jgi:hypothetical protein